MTSFFKKSATYDGHILYFLKEDIKYTTTKPVILSKTKSNYRIKNLSQHDAFILNSLLHGVHKELTLDKRNFYLSSKDIQLEEQETKGFMKILIQGYKVAPANKVLPILKLYDVKYTTNEIEIEGTKDDTPTLVGKKWLNKPIPITHDLINLTTESPSLESPSPNI